MLAKSSRSGFGWERGAGKGIKQVQDARGGRQPGSGPGGNCICPKCGHKLPHEAGKPCRGIACPKCRTMMIRE